MATYTPGELAVLRQTGSENAPINTPFNACMYRGICQEMLSALHGVNAWANEETNLPEQVLLNVRAAIAKAEGRGAGHE